MIYHTGFHPLVFFMGNRDHDKRAVTVFYFTKFMADISMTLFVRIGQDNLDGQQHNIRHYDGRIRVIFLIQFYEVNKVSGFFGYIYRYTFHIFFLINDHT